ncbi:MAG TPA: YraN family protein [Acidobacteriaceae bacterium]|jgi:putative endonuclease
MSTLTQRVYFALSDFAKRRSASRAAKDGNPGRPQHLLTGERGEDLAFFYLRSKGYTVVARRWRSERLRGDLDLVAWDGDTLVIIEVKTRTARDFVPADVAVDDGKQRMLRRMGAAYVRQFPERHRERVQVRFDVLSVYAIGETTEFEHFSNAF